MTEKFSELQTSDQLAQFIKEKEYHHTNYYHYSDIEGIDGIKILTRATLGRNLNSASPFIQ